MSIKDNMVLCLSGFDPTGGAGILADIKAIEATGAYAMGIITSNTNQTEDEFKDNEWMSQEFIMNQLKALLSKYNFKALKIGIIESLSFLNEIISFIKDKNPSIKIIWDPVLKASSGYSFHEQLHIEILDSILSKITLITPNIPEFNLIFDNSDIKVISEKCSILLKGGHSNGNQIIDKLYISKQEFCFEGIKSKYSKHGSGCVLSSTIAGILSQGFSVEESCKKAKSYLNYFINSDKSLLGKHNYNYGN